MFDSVRDLRVTVIGAGSVFTPELVQLLLDRHVPVGELVMMDIDRERLDILADFAERQISCSGERMKIRRADSYKDAIPGSDFICIQARVGGNHMRTVDEELARKHHIPFVETVSIPGLGAFLRSIPVYDEIVELIRNHAPNATVMNFANPAGVLTAYLHAKGISQTVGVCNSPIGFVSTVADLLGIEGESIWMNWKGLNHLTVVDQLLVNGENVISEVIRKAPEWSPGFPFSRHVLDDTGLGLSTYFQYYFHSGKIMKKLLADKSSRGQEVILLEKELLAKYAHPDTVSIPDLLMRRGGYRYSEVVVNLMQSMLVNDHRIHYVNIPNNGTILSLPEDTIVEVPAIVENRVILPLQTGDLPELVRPLALTMATVYKYWVSAALNSNFSDLRKSLLIHPLFPDAEQSEQILDEFFELNKEYVPRYS
jgi:6-phospho-beta-glucosidase